MTYGAKTVPYVIFHFWLVGVVMNQLQSSELISPAIQKRNFMYSNLFFIAFPPIVAFSNYSPYRKKKNGKKEKKLNEKNTLTFAKC